MKKGTVIKCIETYGGYLTGGKNYTVQYVKGDWIEPAGCDSWVINGADSFGLTDDDGQIIFQSDLCGMHGDFEVIS